MSAFNKLKKEFLGHENVELADILQIILFLGLLALLLFISLKVKNVI